LFPGGIAVDATMGNGRDTVFLARCVGVSGKVFALDIQQEALLRTQQRLCEERLADGRVQLIAANHAALRQYIPLALHGKIQAVMFNLGYLPGGDKKITTRPGTTCAALEEAVRLLAPGGIVTVVAYPGHAGGQEEADAVVAFARQLPAKEFHVLQYRLLNRKNAPPFLIALQKRPTGVS
jgi:predicted methyltransferase